MTESRLALWSDPWPWNIPNYSAASSLFLCLPISPTATRALRERDENWEALSIPRFLWTRTNESSEKFESHWDTYSAVQFESLRFQLGFQRCRLAELRWGVSQIWLSIAREGVGRTARARRAEYCNPASIFSTTGNMTRHFSAPCISGQTFLVDHIFFLYPSNYII